MILTCPECASRYFVDDARIGPDGRKVRCASCGHSWRQAGASSTAFDTPLTLAPNFEPSPPPAAAEVSEPPVKLRGARADVSSRLRKEAHEKRRTREAAAVGAVWALLGAGFVVLALVAVIFRTDVVRLMPTTAGAYAFVRMPVNPIGINIEAPQITPGLKDGHAAMIVTGLERNIDAHPRNAAPLRVSLLDKANQKIASQVVTLDGGPIQPGETRPFTLTFIDPPLQTNGAQAEFAFDRMTPKKPATAPRAVAAAKPGPTAAEALQLRGAAPAPASPPVAAKEAAPLPANSPYALPKVAETPHG
jgi:predicted Zn finger-like uncharacterized protein